jgi:hypothetical protein
LTYWPDPGDLYGSPPDGYEEWCAENGYDPEDGDMMADYEDMLRETALDCRADDMLDDRGWRD